MPAQLPRGSRSEAQRAEDLRAALAGPCSRSCESTGSEGLVEPLGFAESALRTKRAAVDAIDAVGGADRFRLLHDTFHHYLAGERDFPGADRARPHLGRRGRSLALEEIRDEHRVLVGHGDRLGNVGQIRALLAGGYAGPFSFEPFRPASTR